MRKLKSVNEMEVVAHLETLPTCRTCLLEIPRTCRFFQLDSQSASALVLIKQKLNYCIPELDLKLMPKAVICDGCYDNINIIHKFKDKCLKSELQLHKCEQQATNVTQHVETAECTEEAYTSVDVKIETDGEKEHIEEDVDVDVPIGEHFLSQCNFSAQPSVSSNTDEFEENAMNQPTDMQEATEQHTKSNVYGEHQCKMCFKNLSTAVALRRHVRIHTGEKPYNCTVCEKPFTQKAALVVHMRVHTGFKPFSCKECNATFSQKSHLLGHMRIHTGEKPFTCSLCPKRFRKSHALQIHKQSHSKKPYQCDGCSILFREEETCQRHIQKFLLKCVTGRAIQEARRLNCTDEAALRSLYQDTLRQFDIQDIRKPLSFKCGSCEQAFTTKFSRDRHVNTIHGREAGT